jgi:hypothetical protein
LKPDHLCLSPEGEKTEYLFESLELEPELPSQYDWHVQPDCQRPIRLPPERRVSVEFTVPLPSSFPAVLETFQTYQPCRGAVNPCCHTLERSIVSRCTVRSASNRQSQIDNRQL